MEHENGMEREGGRGNGGIYSRTPRASQGAQSARRADTIRPPGPSERQQFALALPYVSARSPLAVVFDGETEPLECETASFLPRSRAIDTSSASLPTRPCEPPSWAGANAGTEPRSCSEHHPPVTWKGGAECYCAAPSRCSRRASDLTATVLHAVCIDLQATCMCAMRITAASTVYSASVTCLPPPSQVPTAT